MDLAFDGELAPEFLWSDLPMVAECDADDRRPD